MIKNFLLYILLIPFLLSSCKENKRNSSIPKSIITDSIKKERKITTNTTSSINYDNQNNTTISNTLNENKHYIGFVKQFNFSNENEIYIELYFHKDSIDYNEYTKIEKLADSLIYQDDDTNRLVFSTRHSNNNFDLSGLSKLKIYDNEHHFISDATFLHVEYLNQNISPCFIAVYQTEKKIESEDYYCISNYNENLQKPKFTIFKDTTFTQKILNELNTSLDAFYNQQNVHIQLENNTTISVVNSNDYAYIVLSENKAFKILYKNEYPENIISLKILPVTKNNYPYILAGFVEPETDVMWDALLFFDGEKYISSRHQRME